MSCTLLRTTAANENIVCGPQTIILNWTPILTPETFDLTDIHVMCLSGVYTLLYAFCAPGAPPHPFMLASLLARQYKQILTAPLNRRFRYVLG